MKFIGFPAVRVVVVISGRSVGQSSVVSGLSLQAMFSSLVVSNRAYPALRNSATQGAASSLKVKPIAAARVTRAGHRTVSIGQGIVRGLDCGQWSVHCTPTTRAFPICGRQVTVQMAEKDHVVYRARLQPAKFIILLRNFATLSSPICFITFRDFAS